MSDINLTIQNTTPANLTISTGLGEQGPQGPQGAAGANAPVNVVSIGTVTTGAAGSSAAATMTGTAPNQTLNLTIPQGNVGATGATGPAGPVNTLAVGSVTTGNPGDNAVATITGTAPNQTLNLTLPRGATGPTGATGASGSVGATGPAGASNSLAIGTVTTGAEGSSASASITGTAPSQTLSLTIPRGATGAQGPAGTLSDGSVTTAKIADANVTTVKLANNSVTALKLGTNEQKQICKTWVRFNASGVVLSSFNVSSVVRNSVGNYTVNFSAALPDANYAVSVTTANSIVMGAAITSTTSSVRVTAARVDIYSGFDSECFVTVFGN